MDSPIYSLPDDCLCHVISLTSPRDVYNFSLASICFRSVMDSDAIWQAFLPSDYAVILSRAVNPVIFTSAKDLFFKLSESHVLIDGGTISFGLEKSSGAKCYMISAGLATPDGSLFYWKEISAPPESGLGEVVMRILPSQLDVVGKIDSKALSSNTRYGAYLIYILTETCGDISYSIGRTRHPTSVTIGKHVNKNMVYLEPFYGDEKITAKERNDRSIEVEMGAFYINKEEEDGDVEMKFQMYLGSRLTYDIVVIGIEIRPKHN